MLGHASAYGSLVEEDLEELAAMPASMILMWPQRGPSGPKSRICPGRETLMS
jgi:hypothetical protein